MLLLSPKMYSLAQILTEIQPFKVRENVIFSPNIAIFYGYVGIPPKPLRISRNGFNQVLGFLNCYSKCAYTTRQVKGGLDLYFFCTATFSQNFIFFNAYVKISQERLGLSRNDLNWVVRLRNCYSKCVYRTLQVKRELDQIFLIGNIFAKYQ